MAHTGGHDHHPPAGDRPAGHGMVVVGSGTVVLSHLPMFMKPHNYQVILQAGLGDAEQVYVEDRKAHPDALVYTLSPEPFVLPDLFPPGPGQPARITSFRGDLFRGHFEQPAEGTEVIAGGVEVTVDNVVLANKFDTGGEPFVDLTYVLFGAGDEVWLAHVISQPPDFDQLLSVTVSGHEPSEDELAAGIPLTVPGRKNLGRERIRPRAGDPPVEAVATVDGKPVPVEIRPQVEFYFNDNADLQ
jgi:hypothetical protein